MTSFAAYGAHSRSMVTLVAKTKFTFSITGDGGMLGGSRLLLQAIALRLINGETLVSTPHQAGGSFSERKAGGIYKTVKATAKWMTLSQQIACDPRITDDADRQLIIDAINKFYGTDMVLWVPETK